MPRMTVLDTEYATLWYYPEQKIVHHQFHKFIYGETFRDVMRNGLAIFQQEGVHKWLSDDRKNSVLPQVDIDWGLQNWFPAMIDSGWKYWALVMPDKPVGKASMQRVVESFTPLGIIIQEFNDPDAALQWLESV